MPIALDPDRTVEYVLKAERESDDATVFYLRALSLRERAEVEDAAFTLHGEEVLMKNATRRLAGATSSTRSVRPWCSRRTAEAVRTTPRSTDWTMRPSSSWPR
jgi:hypothetical protein